MTKAEFCGAFPNVAESNSYRSTGIDSYKTPDKALRYLVRP